MWSEECEMSIKKFNEFLTTAPVLTLPVEGKVFTVYSDTFSVDLGCLFMQNGQVISYILRQLKLHERNYRTN